MRKGFSQFVKTTPTLKGETKTAPLGNLRVVRRLIFHFEKPFLGHQ